MCIKNFSNSVNSKPFPGLENCKQTQFQLLFTQLREENSSIQMLMHMCLIHAKITSQNSSSCDLRPTWAEEAGLLGQSRWSLLSWELPTDRSYSSWCEVWISPPMGGKRSGCLRRLSTSVCLQVLSPFPAGTHRESVNAAFKASFILILHIGRKWYFPDLIIACSSSIITA